MKPAFLSAIPAATLLLLSPLHGGIIATDGNVTASMNAGGTALDPAQYIVGVANNVTLTLGTTNIGLVTSPSTSSFNALTVQNGAHLTSSSAEIGGDVGSDNNTILVTGVGSLWNTGTNRIDLGRPGANNTLTVAAGGAVTGNNLRIGAFNAVSTTTGNAVIATGSNSTMTLSGTISVGTSSSSDNMITVQDGALIKLTTSSSSFSIGSDTTAGKNLVRVDGGYFAWSGNHASTIDTWVTAGSLQYWYNNQWTTATSADVLAGRITYAYYSTGAAAGQATGGAYSFTSGYTILTSVSAVPEPGVTGVALAVLLGGLVMHRRRRLLRTQ